MSFRRSIAALSAALLVSCAPPQVPALGPAPEELRLAALGYAREYAALGAVYEWGGQDPLPRELAVDCSGLVVRCYGYACEDFGFSLPFEDSTAAGMLDYSTPVVPEPGDLIFMGEGGAVSHIALFLRREGSEIFLIDSTSNAMTKGVSERSYEADDPRFLSFGRLLVRE
jgi:hypothetical protein